MIFFTSDQHFGHNNIIKYCARPFSDAEEMGREMIARHNSVVSEEDIVWHLGDFAMNFPLAQNIFQQLHGKHHLIVGNHDPCYPGYKYKGKVSFSDYLSLGFQKVSLKEIVDLEGFGKVLLCHLPLAFGDPKFPLDNKRPTIAEMNLAGIQYLFHGHIHEKYCIRDRMVNVGVDVWNFKPVSVPEIHHKLNP